MFRRRSAMKYAITTLLIFLCAAPARTVLAQQSSAKTAPSNQAERSAKREGAITGRVIGPDGQPMAGAVVYADPLVERSRSRRPEAACDGEGNFKLTGLSPAAYVLHAQAPGY